MFYGPEKEYLMSLYEKLVSPGPSGSDNKKLDIPEAWRPRMEIDSDGGFFITSPKTAGNSPDAQALLNEFDLDPEQWSVTSVRKSRWQTYSGEWLESFRASVVPRGAALGDKADVEKIIEDLRKWRPGKEAKKKTGELAFIFAPSDQQIGKKQGDAGTEQTIQRLLDLTEAGVQRLHDLRRIGKSIGTVVIPLPGDHVEGITSQGGRLQGLAASDLGLTEQTRVARRLLLAQIKAFAPLAEKIIVPVVNGNHDEVTRQVAADPSDGWNVEVASSVQDACAENDHLQHVEFRFPAKSHQTLAVEVSGVMLGIFHGHQAGNNVLKYLSEQAAGQTSLGMCDVWISGHYHSFKSMDIGSRLWVQAPTVDPGSDWYRDRRGLSSNPGILTMVIGEGYDPRQDISVLSLNQ
jgi:predicted phosphodiesterase